MNKKQLLRDTVKSTPMWVHSLCTWGKIHQLEQIYLNPKEVSEGENSFVRKEQLVAESCRKHQRRSSSIKKAADRAIDTSPLLKGRNDLDQLRTDILFCYFAYGYVPEEYVFYHLYDHKDEAYRRSYVSEIERMCCRFAMNDFTESSFSDKTVEYETLKAFYGRDAVAVRSQNDFDAFMRFIKKNPVFVEKPAISSMGKGVRIINMQKESLNPREYFGKLEKAGGVWLLEEVIKQSSVMSEFNDSVNTCRVASFRTKDGLEIPWGFFRTGRKGSFADNAHLGGVYAAIDTKEGIICGKVMDSHGSEYAAHPDSGAIFENFALPDWKQALDLIRKAAEIVPKVQYSSWDLAHTDHGWVIVEVNPSGQFLWQASMQKSCKEEIKDIMGRMDLVVPYRLKGR